MKMTALSPALLVVLSGPTLAAYDGWIAGGLAVYGVTAATAAAAKQQAISVCSEAEGAPCGGAFALDAGSPVASARCQSGNLSGYVVGETRQAVERMIVRSSFTMSECVVTE